MAISQLRKASQLTLPSEIKKLLQIKEGDYLDFVYHNGRAYLEPVTVTKRSETTNKLYEFLATIHETSELEAEKIPGNWDNYIDNLINEAKISS